jgi:hypothetical protein
MGIEFREVFLLPSVPFVLVFMITLFYKNNNSFIIVTFSSSFYYTIK